MNPEIPAKLILRPQSKNSSQGFTLVELLVVIVIIGILTAIALPSFLNQTAKAKQVEAKTNISAVNKAQQLWRVEQASFTTNFGDLALGRLVGSSDPAYAYTITSADAVSVVAKATTNQAILKGYASKVTFTDGAAGSGGIVNKEWGSIICESTTPGTAVVADPPSSLACAGGSLAIQ
jgi:type IV pilus assembly protein PilA